MALTFRLATVTLCNMGALLEKLVDVESGAKSYVKLILGWVQSIRAVPGAAQKVRVQQCLAV